MLNIDIKEIERRAHQVFLQDGWLEIFAGVYLLLMGLACAINPSLVVFCVFATLPLRRIAVAAKERYVYPRVGYAAFPVAPPPDPKKVAGVLIGGLAVYVLIMVGALAVLYSTMGPVEGRAFLYGRFVPAFVGCLFAIGPIVFAVKFAMARGYVFAAASVFLGFAVPSLGLDDWHKTLALQMLILGVLALLSGLVFFARFLRKYPATREGGPVGSS